MSTATRPHNHTPATTAKPAAEMNREELLQQVIDETKAQAEFVPYLEKDPIKLNVGIVKRLIAKPTKRGFLPSDRDIINFISLCKARALNPFVGDAFLVGYDSEDGPTFNLITAHQSLLKRAEGHDQYDGMKGGIIVLDGQKNVIYRDGAVRIPGDTLHGAWAKIWRKDRSHPTEVEIEIGARTGRSPLWRTDPCGMIVKCTKSAGLREAFPSTLSGMYTEEEFDVMQRGQHEGHSRVQPSSLTERLAPRHIEETQREPEPAAPEVDEAYQPSPDDEPAGGWEPEESEATA